MEAPVRLGVPVLAADGPADSALGPPEAAGRGRWSSRFGMSRPRSVSTHRRWPLERHGVLTRRQSLPKASTADSPGSTPSCEPSRRRAGSGADTSSTAWELAQFALAGALDRLRAVRDGEEGSAAPAVRSRGGRPGRSVRCRLAWPRRGDGDVRPLQRAAGAYVVLVDGIAALYLERGGSSLQTLPAADDPNIVLTALRGLTTIVAGGRLRELVIRKVDGVTIGESPWRDRLLEVGFTAGYRGLTLRAAR